MTARGSTRKAADQRAQQLDGHIFLPRWVLASVAEQQPAWAKAREHLQLIMASLAPGDPRTAEIRERLANVERGLHGNSGQ